MADEKKEVVKREAEVPTRAERTSSRPTFLPAVDIYEGVKDTILVADMPGVDEKSVSIELESGILTLTGEVPEVPCDGCDLVYSEYRAGDYQRSFRLADTVDRNRIEATVKNGVLRIVLPKAEEALPKKIQVNAGS